MDTNRFLDWVRETMPWMNHYEIPCPYAEVFGPVPRDYSPECEYSDKILWQVIHLNDDHQWSREKIASWLEETASRLDIDLTIPVPRDLTRPTDVVN